MFAKFGTVEAEQHHHKIGTTLILLGGFFCRVGACGNTWTCNPNSLKFQNFSASKSWSPNMTFGWTQTSNFCSIARPNRFSRKGSGHETSMLWHVLLNTDMNYRSLLQNYSLCKMVVTFMFRVEASVTEIKIEPSDQSSFWSQSSDQCNFQTDQDMWLQFDL